MWVPMDKTSHRAFFVVVIVVVYLSKIWLHNYSYILRLSVSYKILHEMERILRRRDI